MAELTENLIYLVITFFSLAVIGLIYMIVINGTFLPIMQNTVNLGYGVPMDNTTKSEVLGGFIQVNTMIKYLIPGLFLAVLIAVIMFIFFRREEENQY